MRYGILQGSGRLNCKGCVKKEQTAAPIYRTYLEAPEQRRGVRNKKYGSCFFFIYLFDLRRRQLRVYVWRRSGARRPPRNLRGTYGSVDLKLIRLR